jgi:hypothetical protein
MTHSCVMAGLVPAIHDLLCFERSKTWMPGTRPGMTKDTVSVQCHWYQVGSIGMGNAAMDASGSRPQAAI